MTIPDDLDAWENLLAGRSSGAATATPQVAAPTAPSPTVAGEGSAPAPAGPGEGALPPGARRIRRDALRGPQPIEDLLAGQDQAARGGVRPGTTGPAGPVPTAKPAPAPGDADGTRRATTTPDGDDSPTATTPDAPGSRRQDDADGGATDTAGDTTPDADVTRRPAPDATSPDDPTTTPGDDDARQETDGGDPTTTPDGDGGGPADATTPDGGEESGTRRRRPWRRRATPDAHPADGAPTADADADGRGTFADDIALARQHWADARVAARDGQKIVVEHTWGAAETAAPAALRMDRVRSSLYWVSAAAAGYLPAALGNPDAALPTLTTRALNSIATEHSISSGIVLAGLLAAGSWFLFALPTRRWPVPLAWTCRIPTASVILGSLLWAPAWNNLNL
ncbi:hypothetical protein GCM10027160_23710 [Streptomyces calidiresistens]